MSPRKIIFATSLCSALFVLAVAAPLAYFGLQELDRKLQAERSELQGVVVELKDQAMAEIRTAAEQAAMKATADAGAGAPTAAVTASLASLESGMQALRESVGTLQAEQKKLADLMQLRTEGLVAAVASVKAQPATLAVRPGTRKDTLNQTIYFSLGVFRGAKTDERVAAVVPKIRAYSAQQSCVSNVMGFSDTLGGDKSNLELSLKRAEHVATLLRAQQIPVGTVKGWGERWLDEHTVDGVKNDKNRRVVIETVCGEAAEAAPAPTPDAAPPAPVS